MEKWADYLISKVSYDSNHLIDCAMRHQDSDDGIAAGILVDRLTIVSDIKKGFSYMTIYSGKNSWKMGLKINTCFLDRSIFLRIDKNKAELDHLGDLPEILGLNKSQIRDLESRQQPAEEAVDEDEATPEQLSRAAELERQIRDLEST